MESLDNEVLEELRRRDLLVRLLVVAGPCHQASVSLGCNPIAYEVNERKTDVNLLDLVLHLVHE
ncbi:hypothetical protein Droror1_Dr00000065, partial [Drosera rotundifolia]